ncbi:MAG: carboxylate-amine ligase [Aphanocapsa feldmannii 277cV]|uniref:Carboxylate-amine ligase n=1 Tax=Aphanocapsa feldmannii 277cV TaxID=2507553 RepID=A0A524RNW4_9CHRO|nr:MAG: carboxylate-amine ligase [Aphanocapsa feldmannii 277cV]
MNQPGSAVPAALGAGSPFVQATDTAASASSTATPAHLLAGLTGADPDSFADVDVLVIPSISLDATQLESVSGAIHYEERMLVNLGWLRQPTTRVVYLTSQPLVPELIEYHLQLIPGIPTNHARRRLLLRSVSDASPRPLTQKVLERPRFLARLRAALRPGRSLLVCFNVTELEERLARALGLPLLGTSPSLHTFGSKSGSRALFRRCGLPLPRGMEQLPDRAAVAEAAVGLVGQAAETGSAIEQVIVKLEDGFSGEGNALLDLRPLLDGSRLDRRRLHTALMDNLIPMAGGLNAAAFWDLFEREGGVLEERVRGQGFCSPSVQLYLHPDRRVEVVSTHDQVLGGADDQVYLGCRFPARSIYRQQLHQMGLTVGQALAAEGAMDRCAVDTIAFHDPEAEGAWKVLAIEINLRKGGTTHPLVALQQLTGGRYELPSGCYRADGQVKRYIATDNLCSNAYRGLLPEDLMEMVAERGHIFDAHTRRGVVFLMVGALSEHGKLGLTCIDNSLAGSEHMLERVRADLDNLAADSAGTPLAMAPHWH